MDKKRDLKVLKNYMEEQFCQRCVIRNECEKISWCPIEKKVGIDMLSDFGKFLGEICKE